VKKLVSTLVLIIALSGCAAFWTAVRTVADIARCLCETTAAEQVAASPDALGGMSPEEWCGYEENLRPFIDHVTAAKVAASQQVGFGR